MEFESTYKRYKDGIATDEEKAFVESEIVKARTLTALLDSEDGQKEDIVAEAEMKVVRKIKRKHSVKSIIKTAIIAVIAVLVVVGSVLGGVFGVAATNANNSLNYDRQTAEQLAINYMQTLGYADANFVPVVVDFEKHLSLELGISRAYYSYDIEVRAGRAELEIIFNAKNGHIQLDDVSYD